MLTVSLDVSMQERHWQLLSVLLWPHCNPPIAHEMNDAWKVNHTTGETSSTELRAALSHGPAELTVRRFLLK